MTEEQPAAPAPPMKFTLGDVYYLLFRRKGLIFLFTLAGIAAAAVVYIETPAFYRSEARLLVRYIAETAPVEVEAAGGRIIPGMPRGANVIETETEILTSQAIAEEVVKRVGAERIVAEPTQGPKYRISEWVRRARARIAGVDAGSVKKKDDAEPAAAEAMVAQGLNISLPGSSNIIRLYFSAPDRLVAHDVLAALVDVYLKTHAKVHRGPGSYEFLAQQTDQIRARLNETEAELQKLKKEAGIASIAEAKLAAVRRVEELRASLQNARTSLAAGEARLAVLKASAGTTPAVDGAVSAAPRRDVPEDLASALVALRRLRLRELELLATYTPDSIPVSDVRARITELRAQIETKFPAAASITNLTDAVAGPGTSDSVVDGMAQVAGNKAAITAIEANLAEALTQVETLNAIEGQIIQLERKRALEADNYEHFAKSLEQAKIDDALDTTKISNISIVQPATLPSVIWRPRVVRNVGGTLAGGILGGIALAFVLEFFLDRSIKRPVQVERSVGVPLLITVPVTAGVRRVLTAGTRGLKLLPAASGRDSDAGQGSTGRSGGARHRAWNVPGGLRAYFEALRDRVLARIAVPSEAPHLIGITSCRKGSGVTTTATGLATTFARNGDGRVLFVDAADLDFTSANQLLGSGSSAGLIDIVADDRGNTTIVQPNLYVLSATEVDEDFPRMNLTESFERLMDYARQSKYRFVVFDLPPIDETSLALRIAPHLDSIILVVEAEKVQEETAQRAQELLARAHANLIGTVLNKRRTYVPQWLHQTH